MLGVGEKFPRFNLKGVVSDEIAEWSKLVQDMKRTVETGGRALLEVE